MLPIEYLKSGLDEYCANTPLYKMISGLPITTGIWHLQYENHRLTFGKQVIYSINDERIVCYEFSRIEQLKNIAHKLCKYIRTVNDKVADHNFDCDGNMIANRLRIGKCLFLLRPDVIMNTDRDQIFNNYLCKATIDIHDFDKLKNKDYAKAILYLKIKGNTSGFEKIPLGEWKLTDRLAHNYFAEYLPNCKIIKAQWYNMHCDMNRFICYHVGNKSKGESPGKTFHDMIQPKCNIKNARNV